MKQKVLITTGPTNEYIDKVMKITNMSKGSTGLILANEFINNGYEVTLIANNAVINHKLVEQYSLKRRTKRIVLVETTNELEFALKNESKTKYDIVIHSAAVGDYIPEFCFNLDAMAKEISLLKKHDFASILKTLKKPKCKISNKSKISSMQSDLTVKLGLTPKLISELRNLFPLSTIYGFKLLENVSKKTLVSAATKIIEKSNIDFVVANDLKNINNGKIVLHIVDKDGKVVRTLNSVEKLAKHIIGKIIN